MIRRIDRKARAPMSAQIDRVNIVSIAHRLKNAPIGRCAKTVGVREQKWRRALSPEAAQGDFAIAERDKQAIIQWFETG